MSAIKTLYVLYKAVTEPLQKGNDEVNKSNDKVQKSLKQTEDFADSFTSKIKSLAKEIAIASGLIYTASNFIGDFKNSVNFGRELSVTSNLLNINAEELQAWGNALKHVGGDAKSFEANIQAIAKYFNVTPDRALKFVPFLADAFSKLNRQQASTFGSLFNLDPAFIKLLQKGPSGLSDFLNKQKDFGILTQAQVDQFGKLNDKIVDTKNAFEGLFSALAADQLPELDKFFSKALKYLVEFRKNLDVVKTGIQASVIAIVGTLGLLSSAFSGVAIAILGVVGAYEAYKVITQVSGNTGALTSHSGFNASLSDIVGFNNAVKNPLAIQPASSTRNSSTVINNNQNTTIDTLYTKIQDAKEFQRYINKGNFSQSFLTQQGNYQVASGVQA